MSLGAVYPSSAFPADTSGRLFATFYNGTGGNAAPHDEGLGIKASLDADATWELRFPMPPTIPTGTLKLRGLFLTSDTGNHVIKYTVSDATVSAGSSPSAATLTAETQTTVTWAANANDKYQEAKTTLTASPAGNDMLVVAVKFQTSGWTVNAIVCAIFSVIWE